MTTATNGGKTGAPPGMLQDDHRGLSNWLASTPDARLHAREAAQAIAAEPAAYPPLPHTLSAPLWDAIFRWEETRRTPGKASMMDGVCLAVEERIEDMLHAYVDADRAARAVPAVPSALQKDAERYRWLRDENTGSPEPMREICAVMFRAPFTDDPDLSLFGENLDAAIDAAMQSGAAPTTGDAA